MIRHCLIATAAIAALGAACARAGLDLSTPGSSGYLAGGLFQQGDVQPAGTGVFNTFLQIQAQNARQAIEQGYNTDYRPAQFDEKNDAPHNHSLLLADVPLVSIGGVEYRQFLLDINQPKGGGSASDLLSLDNLQIFQSNDAALHNFPTFDGQATQIFNLSDAGASITLNASLSHGSGQSDMIANIPNALFKPSDPYVTLYSQFGATLPAHGGFEEWGVGRANTPTVTTVPLPRAATQGLIGIGLALVLGAVWTRRRRRAAGDTL